LEVVTEAVTEAKEVMGEVMEEVMEACRPHHNLATPHSKQLSRSELAGLEAFY